MESPKVVLLSCGEEVYPRAWLDGVIQEVRIGVAALDVELVHAGTVMNESDARVALQALKGVEFDLVVVHLVSWHITSNIMLILRDYKRIPVLVWATGGRTDAGGKLHSPAAPAALTALLPALKEMGFRYKALYEKPDEPHHFDAVAKFARVAGACRRIRNSRIGLIGYADMGLYTCTYDRTSVANRLGIDVEDYFSYEIGTLMDAAPPEEVEAVVADIRARLVFENAVSPKVLDRVARLYHALKKKADGRGLDAISIKCVNGVTRYMGVNPCIAQSLLADADLSVICECDAYGLITNVMLSMLTGQTSSFMENYEFFDDEILVGTCGFLPFDFIDGPAKARSTNLGDFFTGMGQVSRVRTGTVTFARLFKDGEGYGMFLSKAEARTPGKWIELGWEEPTPDFPSLVLKLEMPLRSYVENVPGQHIILVFGDHVESLKDLCALMDIAVLAP